jgi:hypothetical protein
MPNKIKFNKLLSFFKIHNFYYGVAILITPPGAIKPKCATVHHYTHHLTKDIMKSIRSYTGHNCKVPA